MKPKTIIAELGLIALLSMYSLKGQIHNLEAAIIDRYLNNPKSTITEEQKKENQLEELVIENKQRFSLEAFKAEKKYTFIASAKKNSYIDSVYFYVTQAKKKLGIENHRLFTNQYLMEMIHLESSFEPYAQSIKGAKGLMQLTKQAWQHVEKKHQYETTVFLPQTNIEVGIKYLLFLEGYIKQKNPNWENLDRQQQQTMVAAAYNGGISRLEKRKWNIAAMPKETKNYAKAFY